MATTAIVLRFYSNIHAVVCAIFYYNINAVVVEWWWIDQEWCDYIVRGIMISCIVLINQIIDVSSWPVYIHIYILMVSDSSSCCCCTMDVDVYIQWHFLQMVKEYSCQTWIKSAWSKAHGLVGGGKK